jgi:hypothetical protein
MVRGRGVYFYDEGIPLKGTAEYETYKQSKYTSSGILPPKWDDVKVEFDYIQTLRINDQQIIDFYDSGKALGIEDNRLIEMIMPMVNEPNFSYMAHTQSFDGMLTYNGNTYWADCKNTKFNKNPKIVGVSPNQAEHITQHPNNIAILQVNWENKTGTGTNTKRITTHTNNKGELIENIRTVLLINILTSKRKVVFESQLPGNAEQKKTAYESIDEAAEIDSEQAFKKARTSIASGMRQFH